MIDAKMKTISEDFLVVENSSYIPIDYREDCYCVFQMVKSGYTTFYAIEVLAQYYEISESEIGYCGLKDEDAITTQLITIHIKHLKGKRTELSFRKTKNDFLEIRKVGYCETPFKIGRLQGNSFKIIIRNLPEKVADYLYHLRRKRLFVPNYFDTQRFGVAGGVKTTHIIGEHLVNKDYESALNTIISSNLPESQNALQFINAPQNFFSSMEKRKMIFYYNSFSAFQFNKKLGELIKATIQIERKIDDTIEFNLAKRSIDLISILELHPTIEYDSYRLHDDEIVLKKTTRSSIICPLICFNDCFQDQFFQNMKAVDLSFSLEAGCYATLVVKQLLCEDFIL